MLRSKGIGLLGRDIATEGEGSRIAVENLAEDVAAEDIAKEGMARMVIARENTAIASQDVLGNRVLERIDAPIWGLVTQCIASEGQPQQPSLPNAAVSVVSQLTGNATVVVDIV